MRLSTNVIRNFAAVAVSLVIATAGLSTVAAQEKPKASPPVLVTSLGQSLDAFQIQLVVRRAGIRGRRFAAASYKSGAGQLVRHSVARR